MLYATLLNAGAAICRHAAKMLSVLRHYCVGPAAIAQDCRDFALPNPTWSRQMLDLYDRFMRLSEGGAWRRIPSYDTVARTLHGKPIKTGGTRVFTRSQDKDGVGFEYCMFLNKAEKRMVCVFQPGIYLEGPPGYTHGGCLATMIDSTIWLLILHSCGQVMTANLSINYRNPVPLGATVLIDSRVDKVEGRKIYAVCQVRSHDDAVIHTDATGLLIKRNVKDGQAADSAAEGDRPLEGSRL